MIQWMIPTTNQHTLPEAKQKQEQHYSFKETPHKLPPLPTTNRTAEGK